MRPNTKAKIGNVATVATIRPAPGDEFFAAKADPTVATFASLNFHLHFIYEMHLL